MPTRVLGVLIMALAIPIILVPQFTNCYSEGKQLTLANGRNVPMKCLWTARAEIAVGVPLFFVGGALALSKRRETKRGFAMASGVLGLFALLLPVALIGVCSTAGMTCNSVMKPTLMLLGGLVMGASILSLGVSEFFSGRGGRPAAAAAG